MNTLTEFLQAYQAHYELASHPELEPDPADSDPLVEAIEDEVFRQSELEKRRRALRNQYLYDLPAAPSPGRDSSE